MPLDPELRHRQDSKCPMAHGALAQSAATARCPVGAAAAGFDPFSDGYQQDPPEYLRWAREQEPIFHSPVLDSWVVTRFEDIKAIFRDNITFSPAIALEKITPTGPEANAVLAGYGYAMNRTLVNEDEPAHMPRRRLLMEPFTQQRNQKETQEIWKTTYRQHSGERSKKRGAWEINTGGRR